MLMHGVQHQCRADDKVWGEAGMLFADNSVAHLQLQHVLSCAWEFLTAGARVDLLTRGMKS